MSASWVIDSSVGLAWVHPDQATLETDKLLTKVASGTAIVVPAFWFLEIANVLLVLQRRKKITREHRNDALKMLSALNPTVDEESSKAAFHKTSELAEKHGLTIYDATYVELAMRRKLHLASRDASLSNAAKQGGVKVF